MSTPNPVPANTDETTALPQNGAPAIDSQTTTPMPVEDAPVMPSSEPASMNAPQDWAQPQQPATPYSSTQAPYGQNAPGQSAQGHAPYGQSPYTQSAQEQAQSYEQAAYGQAPYAQAPYGQPAATQYYATPAPVQLLAERLRSNSMFCLVLGILGLVMIGLLGSIPAWVWGNSIIKQAAENGIPEEYISNAKLGRILGMVGTWIWIGLAILMFIFIIGMVIFAIAAGASGL